MIRFLVFFLVLQLYSFIAFAQQANFIPITVPDMRGPVPISEGSYPQLAVSRTQTPIELAAAGYVEEEYIISGFANIYDWDEASTISVRTPDAPYATRILVRRPADPDRFSGNVVVETLNNARDYDWAFIWALSYEHFLAQGDVFVAVTHSPDGIHALQEFDPIRYGELSLANPNPNELCGRFEIPSYTEEGLKWDMISQVSALLRSNSGPLSGFDMENIYISSHSGELTTYANSVHRFSRLENGNHAYDGFVIKSEYARADRINRCVDAPDEGDPRHIIRNAGVPVIRLTAQGDVLATFSVRREDSDDPVDPYRLWEVAGAPHMDKIYYEHMPIQVDQFRAGQQGFLFQWPMDYVCELDIELLDFPVMRHAVNAAFAAVDKWARTDTPPPRAVRVGVSNGGTAEAAYINDDFLNATGGMRSVYLDLPIATYYPHTPGPAVCRHLGRKAGFSWSRLEALYGSAVNYAEKLEEALAMMVEAGWLTPGDSLGVRMELLDSAITLE